MEEFRKILAISVNADDPVTIEKELAAWARIPLQMDEKLAPEVVNLLVSWISRSDLCASLGALKVLDSLLRHPKAPLMKQTPTIAKKLFDALSDASEFPRDSVDSGIYLLLRKLEKDNILKQADISRQLGIKGYPTLQLEKNAIWEAASSNQPELLRTLVKEYGSLDANWGHPDYEDATALHVACAKDHLEVVTFLLSLPLIDVNKRNLRGQTPLFLACLWGRSEIVGILLRVPGVSTNLADYRNCTPLWIAARDGRDSLIRWFIASARAVEWNAPGKISTEPNHRTTPIEIARKRNYEATADLLEKRQNNSVEALHTARSALRISSTSLEKALQRPLSSTTSSQPVNFTIESQVSSLCFADCGLSSLPNLVPFSHLHHLDLSWNRFDSIPMEIKGLKHLTKLKIFGLKLTSLHPLVDLLSYVPISDLHLDAHYFLDHPTEFSILLERPNLKFLELKGFQRERSEYAKNSALVLKILDLLLGARENGAAFPHIEVEPHLILSPNDAKAIRGLPHDVRQRPVREIIQRLAEGKPQGGSEQPIYRSKILTVGFERAGKTSLIERLFPLKLTSNITVNEKPVDCVEVAGKTLSIAYQESRGSLEAIDPGDGNWRCVEVEKDALLLSREQGPKSYYIHVPNAQDREQLLLRLETLVEKKQTHGIVIQHHEIIDTSLPADSTLTLRVCDFAGQHSYYNNHHYFLSAWSIILVVWNVTKGKPGELGGLRFWLQSLNAHLPPQDDLHPNYSVFVVGTHIDQLDIRAKETYATRSAMVKNFEKSLSLNFRFQYFDVSSKDGKGIDALKSRIIDAARGHEYMGKRVPSSYRKVEELLKEVRSEPLRVPVIFNLEKNFFPRLLETFGCSKMEGMKALELLHNWGDCVLFKDPSSENMTHLVLDPSFLSQDILSRLFASDCQDFFNEGKLPHSQLSAMCGLDHQPDIQLLLDLLEKFEVCFELPANESVDFFDRESVVPSYLPDQPSSPIDWPELCPRYISQVTRRYTFNQIPRELVSRLLVRLHRQMEGKVLWRTGLFLESQRHKAAARVAQVPHMENILEVAVRADLAVARGVLAIVDKEIAAATDCYPGVHFQRDDSETRGETPSKELWWDFALGPGWEVIPSDLQNSKSRRLQIIGKNVVGNSVFLDKLKYALRSLGGDVGQVEEAHCIFNPDSFQSFEALRVNLTNKHILSPSLHKLDTWKTLENGITKENATKKQAARRETLNLLSTHYGRFDWNKSSNQLEVCLMAHGTSLDTAWKIAQSNFGVHNNKDDGWYGRGIYLTSSINYAAQYTRDGDRAVVITAVFPGNAFPVTECVFERDSQGKVLKVPNRSSFLGKPITKGYQSHYVIVNRDDGNPVHPGKPFRNSSAVDELVLGMEMTLPLFIVKMKPRDPILTEVVYKGETSTMEREKSSSIDYLLGAVQHHLNTSRNLELFYCYSDGSSLPLSDVSVLRSGVKLKAKQVLTRLEFETCDTFDLIDYLASREVFLSESTKSTWKAKGITAVKVTRGDFGAKIPEEDAIKKAIPKN